MKKRLLFCLFFAAVLLTPAAVNAADVAITSVGQSTDGMMVVTLMKKMKIEHDYDALMVPEAVSGKKALIVVVGGSLKGLGAANTSREREKTRGKDIIIAAKKKNVKVIIMHVGGQGRRGNFSDMLINTVTNSGDRIIVVKDGNADKLFDRLKAPDVKLVETDNILEAAAPLRDALEEYGVIRK